MECEHVEQECWSEEPPRAPPAPPLPPFLPLDLIRRGVNSSLGCDLCAWADPSLSHAPNPVFLSLSSLLVIVAIVSALAGASLTATLISIKRWRSRGSVGMSASVRHLTRKRNESSSAGTSSASAFTTSSALSENTYCEGPYEKEACSNIYAELHPTTSTSGIWNRPPIPTPSENCYLELTDLPSQQSSCSTPVPVTWLPQESPSSSAHSADWDLARRTVRPV